MFAPRVYYAPAALLALAAVAQPSKETVEPAKSAAGEKTVDADMQQRRALLRASLRAQPDITLVRDSTPFVARQLSDQERADLRQQLRQQ